MESKVLHFAPTWPIQESRVFFWASSFLGMIATTHFSQLHLLTVSERVSSNPLHRIQTT